MCGVQVMRAAKSELKKPRRVSWKVSKLEKCLELSCFDQGPLALKAAALTTTPLPLSVQIHRYTIRYLSHQTHNHQILKFQNIDNISPNIIVMVSHF